MDRNTFLFYFEDDVEIEMVLKMDPWSFDNSLLVIHKLDPSASLSNLLFDSIPIWIRIHNLPSYLVGRSIFSNQWFSKVT